MQNSPDKGLQAVRDRLAADTEAFVKRGGKIKHIPSGLRTDVPTNYNRTGVEK